MQIVQHFRICIGQTGSEKVSLLLIVAFETNPISGPHERLEQSGHILWRYHLSRREFASCGETFVAGASLSVPICHVVYSSSWWVIRYSPRSRRQSQRDVIRRARRGSSLDCRGPARPGLHASAP